MTKRFLKTFVLICCIFVGITSVNASSEVEEVSTISALSKCLRGNEKTCKLVSDFNLASDTQLAVTAKVTLDLNNHVINGPLKQMGLYVYGGDLTVIDSSSEGNGSVTNTNANSNAISLYKGGKVTIEGGSFSGDYAGIYTYKSSATETAVVNGGTVEGLYGIFIGTNDVLIVNGGEVKGRAVALSNNGNNTNTSMTINGGKINQYENDSLAIYHPGEGVLTLNGGIVTGGTGIEMRAGTLNIPENSTVQIIATSSDDVQTRSAGSGSAIKGGNAIGIAQHTTKHPININIAGGTISSKSILYEANTESNSADDINKIKINISGGTFNITNGGTTPIYSEDFNNFISGGIFTVNPSLNYVSTEKQVKEIDSKYHVTDYDRNVDYIKLENGSEESIADIVSGSNTKDILLESVEEDLIKNKNVEFKLLFEEVSDTISVDNKNTIATVTKDIKEFKMVDYVDITVNVIDADSDTTIEQIEELTGNIKLSIKLSDSIPPVAKEYRRDFYVIRMHDGVAEKIDCELSEDGKDLIFESNKFSIYAYGYVDSPMPNTPATYDNTTIYIAGALVSLITIVGVNMFINKKRLN